MKKLFITVTLLMLTLVSPTGASYYKMKKEIKNYQPPLFYNNPTAPETTTKAEISLDETVQTIETLKKKWMTQMKGASGDAIFFKLNRKTKAIYTPLAGNESQVAELFKASIHLKDLLIITYLRNPGILAAESRFLSAIEQFDQALALDLTLKQYTAFTSGVMTGVGPMKGKDPVQMKFPRPSMFSLKTDIVQNDVTARFEALEAYRRDTLASARVTFWELFYVHKAQGITQKNIALLNQMENVAKARYEAGRTSFQDVVNIQIKALKLKEKLKTLRLKQGALETNIRALLNLDGGYPVGKPEELNERTPVLTLSSLKSLGVIKRQEIRKMTAMIHKMERMIQMTKRKILPDLSLGYSYLDNQMMPTVGSGMKRSAFSSSITPSMGKGTPKNAWYGINDAYLNETRLKLSAALSEKKDMEQKTRARIEKRWLQFDGKRRDVRLYRKKVVGLAKSAMDVAMAGYESGNVSFASMIGAYSQWLNASLNLYRSTADQWIAIAGLEKITGVLLHAPHEILSESIKAKTTSPVSQ